MFKNLKERVASQANKANQLLFSIDSVNFEKYLIIIFFHLTFSQTSASNDSGIRTSSIASRDENLVKNIFFFLY